MDGSSSLLGPLELMILWALKEIFSGGVLGLPADARDPKLLQAAPPSAVVYVEWAGRSAGREGASGVDGLMGDPEIVALLKEVDRGVREMFGEEEGVVDEENPLLSQPGYALLKRVLAGPGAGYLRLDTEAMRTASGAAGAEDAWPKAALAGVEGALVLNAGDEADALEERLLALVNSLKDEDEPLEKLEHHVLPTTSESWHVTLHRHERYFIVGLGKDATRRVVERLSAGKPGIDANAGFQAAMQPSATKAPPEGRVASLAWIDIRGALTAVSEALGQRGKPLARTVDALGLTGVKSFTRTTTVVEGEIRTRATLSTDGRAGGLLALAGGRPLRTTDFAHVPADASLVAGASVDVAKLLAGVKEIAAKLDPDAAKAIDDGLKQWEDEMSLSLGDIFAGFGDVWTLHAAPSQGTFLLSGGVLALEVKDAARARTVVDKLQAAWSQSPPRDPDVGDEEAKFTEHEFLGRRIVALNPRGTERSITPAFCLTDTHLLFALNTQAIKTQLRQSKSGKIGPKSSYSGHELPPGDHLFVCRIDAKAWTTQLAAALPAWGRLLSEQLNWNGLEIDSEFLPSIEALLPYASPFEMRATRADDGLRFESRGGLPIPGGAGLILNLIYWMHENEFTLDDHFGALREQQEFRIARRPVETLAA